MPQEQQPLVEETIIHKYTGASLVKLLEKFGIGEKGFYSDWWKNEPFAKEKSPKKTYKIVFHKEWNNLTYQEQLNKLEDEEFLHPAILVEAILTHYQKTGERIMEDWYSRTISVSSVGGRVYVGYFGAEGLYVLDYWGGYRYDILGVSSARKFKIEPLKSESLNPFENLNIEISEIKVNGKIYKLTPDQDRNTNHRKTNKGTVRGPAEIGRRRND
jgi:hypothetical protein